MDILSIITDLENLSGPDRNVDEKIGEYIGMVQASDYWALGAKTFRRLPYFTMSVDAALLLVESTLGVTESGGVTWKRRAPSCAVVDDGPQCIGANRAIALCIAALKRKQQIQ